MDMVRRAWRVTLLHTISFKVVLYQSWHHSTRQIWTHSLDRTVHSATAASTVLSTQACSTQHQLMVKDTVTMAHSLRVQHRSSMVTTKGQCRLLHPHLNQQHHRMHINLIRLLFPRISISDHHQASPHYPLCLRLACHRDMAFPVAGVQEASCRCKR